MYFHYLYKTTNSTSGKIYVGVHSTRNLDDGYMGSGKLLRRAITKHGIHRFTKTILMMCDTREAAYDIEGLIVDESFISRPDTYNIATGGYGGFFHINSDQYAKRSAVIKTRQTFEAMSQDERDRINAMKVNRGARNGMYGVRRIGHTKGRVVTDECKEKQRKSLAAAYEADPTYRERIGKYERTDEHKKRYAEVNSRVYLFSKDDQHVEVKNLAQYCRDNGINEACMRSVYAGRAKSHKGYKKYVR